MSKQTYIPVHKWEEKYRLWVNFKTFIKTRDMLGGKRLGWIWAKNTANVENSSQETQEFFSIA